MTESIRSTFLPNEGCIFVRVDLSQVEDRIVKMATRQPRMVELANRRPEIYDAHTENAAIIFNIIQGKISKEQRYLGKRAVHAAQRGMAGKTLSEKLLEDDYIFTPKKCQGMIDAYLDVNWEIKDYYFPFVREMLIRDKKLINSWGRVWDVAAEFFDDDLFRRAYSFWPQSEAADLLNQWGLKPIWGYIKNNNMLSHVNLQVHDEVITSCPPHEAYSVALFLVKSLERPRVLWGNELRVPACVTVGMSWDTDESKNDWCEWKRLPEREEFEAKCQMILATLKDREVKT